MKLGGFILLMIIILTGIWYFFPDQFSTGKNWVFDTVKSFSGKDTTSNYQEQQVQQALDKMNLKHEFVIEDYGVDFGRLANNSKCNNEQGCEDYFQIVGMNCSTKGTCFIEFGGNTS